jgi:hypothetical protein
MAGVRIEILLLQCFVHESTINGYVQQSILVLVLVLVLVIEKRMLNRIVSVLTELTNVGIEVREEKADYEHRYAEHENENENEE